MDVDLYGETFPFPRAVRFPVEMRPPRGFNPLDPATWPRVEGRLEYVQGRLNYLPPCGDRQQDLALRVGRVLDVWEDAHPEFIAGGNEAGMLLGGEVRGADAAVWLRSRLGPYTGGYRRIPPILAVEVSGLDEEEAALRDKAAWYFGRGAAFVWLVLPESREIVVLRAAGGERRVRGGERVAEEPELPGLSPSADEVFREIE